MIELGTCILCSFIGAGMAVLAQRSGLGRYFALVECLWVNDIKRLDDKLDTLIKRIDKDGMD